MRAQRWSDTIGAIAFELTSPRGIVAVVGGLGAAGVTELRQRGQGARVLSRSSLEHSVLKTGAGLVDALAGAAVVVNAVSDTKRMDRLVEGPGRLLAAEVDAGGGTTWNRCRRSRARAAAVLPGQPRQEQAVRESSAPFTVLRSTQFHDFLAWAFAAAVRWHLLPPGRVPVRPAAVEEVARVVTDVSEHEPSGATLTVAGPRVEVSLISPRRGGRPRTYGPSPSRCRASTAPCSRCAPAGWSRSGPRM